MKLKENEKKTNQERKAVENDKVLKRDDKTGCGKCKINQKIVV